MQSRDRVHKATIDRSPPGGGKRSSGGLRAICDQPIDERTAFLEFADGDELIGLVRLVDRTGADHDRWDSAGGEQAGLGAERDLAVGVFAGKALRQQDRVVGGGRLEFWEAGLVLERDARLRR